MILAKIMKIYLMGPIMKGSNFQETAVVETKSIFGAANLMHRSQFYSYVYTI